MKRTAKIGISIFVVGVVGLVISTCLNMWMKSLVHRQLDANIAAADSLFISYGDIKLTVLTGKAWIKDVHFRSDTAQWDDQAEHPMMEAQVDMLSLDGINYYNWLVRRQLNLKGLTIVNPSFRIRFTHTIDEERGDLLQKHMDEARKERLESILKVARIFIDDATISRITVDHASVKAEAINDSLRISVPEFTMSIYDLGYNIKDLLPHYNDSIFHFLLRDVKVYIPKVPMSLFVSEMMAEPNGVLQIKDISTISYLNSQHSDSVVAGVETITVGGFNVAKFNLIKQMDVKNIHLYGPYVTLQIDETNQPQKTQKTSTQKEIAAINQKLTDANLEVIEEFITGLTIDTILLHDATVHVQSSVTDFRLQSERLSLALYGLGYSLIDEVPYHYNDSVYQFYLGYIDIVTPDSVLAITAHNIRYDNGGAFSLGKTHIRHIVDKWQLSHLMGDVPVTLMDMWVDSVHTSSKNIVQEVYSLEKGFFLDTLYADISKLSVFRDARYEVKQPYQLPQAYLTQLSYPFVVHCVKANVNKINIQMALTKQNIGKLDLGPIRLKISNVTPIPNSVITTNATGRMGTANLQAVFDMTVNKACDWHLRLNATNLDVHHLDSMLYPIVGMTIGCDIHRIQADYGGDTALATGTYCMEYDHVDIFADKNSNSPIKIVRDLSGLINSAGKTIIHPANPTTPDKAPVAYQVKWKNNPWVNPALFYIGPVIDGCIETMLPGLFVHKRVKNNASNKK